jgi:hypothetical protein
MCSGKVPTFHEPVCMQERERERERVLFGLSDSAEDEWTDIFSLSSRTQLALFSLFTPASSVPHWAPAFTSFSVLLLSTYIQK